MTFKVINTTTQSTDEHFADVLNRAIESNNNQSDDSEMSDEFLELTDELDVLMSVDYDENDSDFNSLDMLDECESLEVNASFTINEFLITRID
jgi:hypothetical protein